jgi:hypothetical protein
MEVFGSLSPGCHFWCLVFTERRDGAAVLEPLWPFFLLGGFFANLAVLEAPDMLDRSLDAEFESYRKTLSSDEARRAFDERIERLLSQHGIDYVRGYVGALKEALSARIS